MKASVVNLNQNTASHAGSNQQTSNQTPAFENNRQEAIQFKEMADMTQNSPRTVAQRQAFTNAFGDGNPNPKPNNTGMPDNLKTGLENISGINLSDVKVHYNSSRPAQFQALAYAQGNEIHLGPRQEKYLPHEGWHLVQQKQDRVKPTMQMNGAVVNDDPTLEREADVMGSKAFQFKTDHTIKNSDSLTSGFEHYINADVSNVQGQASLVGAAQRQHLEVINNQVSQGHTHELVQRHAAIQFSSGRFLADDSAITPGGQINKSQFLAELRKAVRIVSKKVLEPFGLAQDNCPDLNYWLEYYQTKDVLYLEQVIARYAPDTAMAETWQEYLNAIVKKVEAALIDHVQTGRNEVDPEEVPESVDEKRPGSSLLTMQRVMAPIQFGICGSKTEVSSVTTKKEMDTAATGPHRTEAVSAPYTIPNSTVGMAPLAPPAAVPASNAALNPLAKHEDDKDRKSSLVTVPQAPRTVSEISSVTTTPLAPPAANPALNPLAKHEGDRDRKSSLVAVPEASKTTLAQPSSALGSGAVASDNKSNDDQDKIDTKTVLAEVYDVIKKAPNVTLDLEKFQLYNDRNKNKDSKAKLVDDAPFKLMGRIYGLLGRSIAGNYLKAEVDAEEFASNKDLNKANLKPQRMTDFKDMDAAKKTDAIKDRLAKGSYFHFNKANKKGETTNRIIVNMNTQQQAIAIAKHIASGWATDKEDWRSDVNTYKIYASNKKDGKKLKNDKMVIYFAEADPVSKVTRQAIKTGVEKFLTSEGVVGRLPLNAFITRIGDQTGTGIEKKGTSFTKQRLKNIVEYVILAKGKDDAKEKWVDDMYQYVLGELDKEAKQASLSDDGHATAAAGSGQQPATAAAGAGAGVPSVLKNTP